MVAVTDVDVANMALDLITEGAIDSLDEDTKAARMLNRHYDVVREAELKLNTWSFALLFVETDIEATDTGWEKDLQYLYEVPEDFLRPAWLTRDGRMDGVPITWSMWAEGIRSDFEGPLKLPYIGNITDPNDFDALFTKALAASLAKTVCHGLSGKASAFQVAKAAYDEAIADARRLNAIVKFGRSPAGSWLYERGDTRFVRP